MRQLLTIFFFAIFVANGAASAQSNCPTDVVYRTSAVGNGKESIAFALRFAIKGDSLRIVNDQSTAKASENVPMLIWEKICNWNADRSEGKSVYKLSIDDGGEIKRPTLTVEIKDKKGTITLQYPNTEPRVFTMIL